MGRSISAAVVKSIQEGYVETNSISSGSGQDTKYLDVTISSVDTEKAVATFVGGNAANAASTPLKSSSTDSFLCSARLTSSTNLRIATRGTSAYIGGSWRVVEYA